MFFRSFINFYVFLFIISFVKADDVTVTVENVGQGNFVIVKRSYKENDGEKSDYMIVDGGTMSYQSEFSFKDRILKIPESQVESLLSPVKEVVASEFKIKKKDTDESIKTQRIRAIREKLKTADFIKVKTIIITHPDLDHYSWIKDLFNQEKDEIGHIILGGLPQDYQESFRIWLSKLLKGKKINIYFPAIAHSPIITLEETLKDSKLKKFAPHLYTTLREQLEEYKEALDFGKDVQLSFLSINSTHYLEDGEISRASLSSDSNSDSLVLKITHGQSSMILTGDATELTFNRILKKYKGSQDFLRTNVLLASHHGASADGCNSLEWIEATQPEIVLISSGLTEGHPHKPAYDIFKQSSRLKTYESGHTIFVADDKRGGQLRKTQRAIFTTLTSGTMAVTLPKDGSVKLAIEYGEARKDKKALEEIAREIILEDEKQADIEIIEGEEEFDVKKTPYLAVSARTKSRILRPGVGSIAANLFPKDEDRPNTNASSAPSTESMKGKSFKFTPKIPSKEKVKEPEEESVSESSPLDEKKIPQARVIVKKSGRTIKSTDDTSESSSAPIPQETEAQGSRGRQSRPILGKNKSSVKSTGTKISAAPSTENPEVEFTKSKVQTKKTAVKKGTSIIKLTVDTSKSSSAPDMVDETTSSSEEETPKKKQRDRKVKKKKTGQK